MTTIKQAVDSFLDNIKKAQPHTTWKNYRSDLLGSAGFLASLAPPVKPASPVSTLDESMGVAYIQSLLDRGLSPSTRQRSASSLREFVRFAAYAYALPLSIDRLNYALKSAHLLTSQKNVINYPGEKIQRVLDWSRKAQATDLTMMRDLALVWSLAETGLRVSEACGLKVGQIDRRWRATFIGKGRKQATVHFGRQSRARITAYLQARARLDKSTGLTMDLLPLFARHDKATGKKKVKPVDPKIAERAIHNIATLALGDDYDPCITAHKFRHYFITQVYKAKGIAVAKDLARHSNIATTDRYAHRDSEENAAVSQEIFG